MTSARKKLAAERLGTFGHYVTAFVILLKGIDKAEQQWHGHEMLVLFLFASSAYIAAGTALHQRVHGRKGQLLQASFYALESVISFAIANYLHHEGKTYLPILFIAAGIAFTIAFVIRVAAAGRPQPALNVPIPD